MTPTRLNGDGRDISQRQQIRNEESLLRDQLLAFDERCAWKKACVAAGHSSEERTGSTMDSMEMIALTR